MENTVATVAVARTQINRNHGLFYFSQEFFSSELNWIFCFIIPQWNFRPKFYGPLFVRLLARILTADTKRFRISLSSQHPQYPHLRLDLQYHIYLHAGYLDICATKTM